MLAWLWSLSPLHCETISFRYNLTYIGGPPLTKPVMHECVGDTVSERGGTAKYRNVPDLKSTVIRGKWIRKASKSNSECEIRTGRHLFRVLCIWTHKKWNVKALYDLHVWQPTVVHFSTELEERLILREEKKSYHPASNTDILPSGRFVWECLTTEGFSQENRHVWNSSESWTRHSSESVLCLGLGAGGEIPRECWERTFSNFFST